MMKKILKPFIAGLIVMISLIVAGSAFAQVGAGNGTSIDINGSGFGTTGPGASNYVQFTSADYNGGLVKPLTSDYILWSDTKITVKIPAGAGTGVIKITNGTTVYTTPVFTINYNFTNFGYNGASFLPNLINENGTGGYTFQMSADFAASAANASFTRAVNTWKCTSKVNWTIGANTSVTAIAVADGVNVVRFATTSDDLDDGVLGVTYVSGTSTDGVRWEVSDADILFNSTAVFNWNFSTAAPGFSQYDFETVALHELGHAELLGHVNNTADVMNPSTANGVAIRTLNADDIAASTIIMTKSTASATSYVYPPMVALTAGSCSISNDATLANLTTSSGTLTPAFAAATAGYAVTVSNATASVTVTPTTTNTSATVTVNGTAVTSGSASASIPLAVGQNTITTIVKAQDGTTTKTYTIAVTRVSVETHLSSLEISAGTLTPVFATNTASYTASVANTITSLTLTPKTTSGLATVTVNGTAVTSGTASQNLPLAVGTNVLTTVVTAQDGTTRRTYTVTVTRGASAVALLTSLTYDPSFTKATVSGSNFRDYTGTVANTITSVKVIPVTAGAGSTVKVNGVAVASGTASAAINLNVGPNTISTVVTAADGVTSNTYSMVVTRQGSTVATLTALTYNPSFTRTTVTGPDYKDYTGAVASTVLSVKVSPTATDPEATIKVNGVAVASGTASAAIPLNVGANTIKTIVTASDGVTTNTYSIVITRATPPPAILTSLTYNPSFTRTTVTGPDYRDYTATVTSSVASVKVVPTSQDPAAKITVNGKIVASGATSGVIGLAFGANTITTIVTSSDGVTSNTYKIVITRPSNIATLASLTYNPSFTRTTVTGADYRDYTATVANSVSSVKVTPTVADSTSTVKVNGVTVASGAASASIPLITGANTIKTIVTAQDGTTTNTYSIVITRGSADMAAVAYVQQTDMPVDAGVIVHNGFSPNGDGVSDYLVIEGIKTYPENTIQIMNRSGALVYAAKGYDNASKIFDGHASTNGKLQKPGTYFYSLDYKVGTETRHKTGYIILKY